MRYPVMATRVGMTVRAVVRVAEEASGLVSAVFRVQPPAGIEPATPSLPSMVGPFGGQRGTSLRPIERQVAGRIDEREMGCCEAVCGMAAGKSLARMQIIVGLAGPARAAMQDSRQLSKGCWCEQSLQVRLC